MSFEHWILGVMSGRTRGVGAAATRAALALAEPAYASAAARRNRRFDDGTREIKRLPRPVISVGNLTTGGTGKTPAVQWLVRELQARGHKPGVLLRGYGKSADAVASDEEALLRESLRVPVVADADRFHGGTAMLAASPEVSVIVLDDGFQHRRLARDVDIVLIDATNPFGFDHVLPRGLLREPVAGIARADLVLLTRSNQVEPASITQIETRIREYQPAARIIRTTHAPAAFCIGDDRLPIDALRGARVFAVSGIGNPAAFEHSLSDAGLNVVGTRRFGDHHVYRDADVAAVVAEAQAAHATHVLTTEKDWVKLAALPGVRSSALPMVRLAIELSMSPDDRHNAIARIESTLSRRQ
jgi:tetraacyldisaccharide 4'-kinase